jgi:hypothetical protein
VWRSYFTDRNRCMSKQILAYGLGAWSVVLPAWMWHDKHAPQDGGQVIHRPHPRICRESHDEGLKKLYHCERVAAGPAVTSLRWFLARGFFLPWRGRRYIPPKCRFILCLRGATSQNTAVFSRDCFLPSASFKSHIAVPKQFVPMS